MSVTLANVSLRPLAEVVGANCKRIRSDVGALTQDELARYARDAGLRWNAAKVGDFEAGRSAPTLATVLAVTLALQWALEDRGKTRRGVTLADLLSNDGAVVLTDELHFPADELAAVCKGRGWAFSRAEYERRVEEDRERFLDEARTHLFRQSGFTLEGRLLQRSGLTEHRLAQRLGISRDRLADLSAQLWQSTFSEERDRRAGPKANPQKRGRASRELRAEIEKALADGDD